MVTLKSYKHENRKVKEKYEFFASTIENTTDIIGKTPHHPIENHLSLIEKIQFQLENNQERFQHKYVKNYLGNSLLSSTDTYLLSDEAVKIRGILEHKNNLPRLRISLNDNIDNLRKRFLKHYVLQVYSIISNDEIGSKSARNKLEYYSNLIVSEYLFEGFTVKDIEFIPHLVISGKTERDNRADCFIKKMNWRSANVKTQLLCLYELCYSEKLNLHYTYGIRNLVCEDNFKYIYDEVTIVSPTSKSLNKYIPKSNRKDFLEQNKAFIYQKIATNSVFTGLNKFQANISNALNYFNTTYSGHAYLDLGNIHIFNIDKKQGQRTWKNLNTELTERKSEIKEDLTDIEATLQSRKNTQRVKNLVTLDKLFFKARQESDLEEKIVFYWRYLESLFNFPDLDPMLTSEKSNYIITRVSRILITEEYQNFYKIVTIGLLNITINMSNRMNLTASEAQRQFLIRNRTFDFEKFQEFPFAKNHLFLGREIKKITNYNKSKEFTKAYNFYISTLKESYEIRNFSVHSGKTFEKSIIKAGLTLEMVVIRIRGILIESFKNEEYNRIQLKSLIEKLSTKGVSIMHKRNGG